jgi:hypothetical protein
MNRMNRIKILGLPSSMIIHEPVESASIRHTMDSYPYQAR